MSATKTTSTRHRWNLRVPSEPGHGRIDGCSKCGVHFRYTGTSEASVGTPQYRLSATSPWVDGRPGKCEPKQVAADHQCSWKQDPVTGFAVCECGRQAVAVVMPQNFGEASNG